MEASMRLSATALQAIDVALAVVSSDKARPVLNAVSISKETGALTVQATDSYVAVRIVVECDKDLDGDETFPTMLVPSDMLRTARKLVPTRYMARGIDVVLNDGNMIAFTRDGQSVGGELIDGSFPDIGQLIEDSYKGVADATSYSGSFGIGNKSLPTIAKIVKLMGDCKVSFQESNLKAFTVDPARHPFMNWECIAMPVRCA